MFDKISSGGECITVMTDGNVTVHLERRSGVPNHHLPSLILSDILDQTPRALNIANISPDIQLQFFLQNRATIDNYAGKAIKDDDKQSFDITRAIWFYRLDEAH